MCGLAFFSVTCLTLIFIFIRFRFMYIYRFSLRIRYYWSLKRWKTRLGTIIANARLHWRLFFFGIFCFWWSLSDHGKLKILLLINLRRFRLATSAREALAGLSFTVWELIVRLNFLFRTSFPLAGVLVWCLRQIIWWESLTSCLRELLHIVPKQATLCRI